MQVLRSLGRRYRDHRRYVRREQQVTTILHQVRPYSMVPDAGLRFVIQAALEMVDRGVPGDFVECGVWQGGSVAAMGLALRTFRPGHRRPLRLFDSFEGLPPAGAEDGQRALAYQANVDDPAYYDNCTATLEQVQANFRALGLLGPDVHFHPGWFDRTLPAFVRDYPDVQIALLRLDGDWYESTKVCLETLYDRVAEGGIIILDDYFYWPGCARAVHEFLHTRGLPHPIRSTPDFTTAYFYKETP